MTAEDRAKEMLSRFADGNSYRREGNPDLAAVRAECEKAAEDLVERHHGKYVYKDAAKRIIAEALLQATARGVRVGAGICDAYEALWRQDIRLCGSEVLEYPACIARNLRALAEAIEKGDGNGD